MIWVINVIIYVFLVNSVPRATTIDIQRRILRGHEVGETRPYMVYLRPTPNSDPKLAKSNWLCGGVIIHELYVLTSAACIEDAKQFYVVSGTHKWVAASEKNDKCIDNGAKRAIWKCVPKSYFYDGDDFDNIRWMIGDIAVVKVEDKFNFERRIKGCDFVPKKINFNNASEDFEKSGSVGTIAGWGSTDVFGDPMARSAKNSPVLLETDVKIVSKRYCRGRWDKRYHYIIDDRVICTQDESDDEHMSKICEQDVNCKPLTYSEEEKSAEKYRKMIKPEDLVVHTAKHYNETRREDTTFGGFCENDHGGPLLVGHGKSATVIGVMSACQTKNITHKCFGPFLYTSVYKYRNLISCAIDKDLGPTCKKLLRSSKPPFVETIFDWDGIEKSIPNRNRYEYPRAMTVKPQINTTHATHTNLKNQAKLIRKP